MPGFCGVTSAFRLISLCCYAGLYASANTAGFSDSLAQLTTCLNRSQPMPFQYSSKARALADEMSPLPVAGAWWSRSQPAVPVTIVTQLSFDRLEQLEAQCRSWHGPISAVAYMALDYSSSSEHNSAPTANQELLAPTTRPEAPLVAAIEMVKRFHAKAEDELPCQVRGWVSLRGIPVCALWG